MNAIKNFLRPTKVTWWVFSILFLWTIVFPSLYFLLSCEQVDCDIFYGFIELLWFMPFAVGYIAFLSIFYLYRNNLGYREIDQGRIDSYNTPIDAGMGPISSAPTFLGYVLVIGTIVPILWIISSIISKIWYSIKNKRLVQHPINL